MDTQKLQADFSVRCRPRRLSSRWSSYNLDYYISGDLTGVGGLIYDSENDLLLWTSFFPKLELPRDAPRIRIGTIAHVKSLLEVIESGVVDKETIVKHLNPGSDRKKHLRTLGVKSGQPLETYLTGSLQYAENQGFRFENPFV